MIYDKFLLRKGMTPKKPKKKSQKVIKDVEVHRNGRTFTQKRLVNADEVKQTRQRKAWEDESKDKKVSFKLPEHGNFKKAVIDLIMTLKSRDKLKSYAQKNNITWEHSDNPNIDWLRASIAIVKHFKNQIVNNSDGSTNSEQSKAPENAPNAQNEQQGATAQTAQGTEQPSEPKSITISKEVARAVNRAESTREKINILRRNLGKEGVIVWARKKGVKWNHNDDPQQNYMNCVRALRHRFRDGSLKVRAITPKEQPTQQQQQQAQTEQQQTEQQQEVPQTLDGVRTEMEKLNTEREDINKRYEETSKEQKKLSSAMNALQHSDEYAKVLEEMNTKTIELSKQMSDILSEKVKNIDRMNALKAKEQELQGNHKESTVEPKQEEPKKEEQKQEETQSAPKEEPKETKESKKEEPKKTIDLELPEKISKEVTLQNRNRANKGSLQQMNSIASDPDYGMMSISRDFANGAPVVSYGTYDPKQLGNISYAITSSDKKRYNIQYAVVEADDVLSSTDIMGIENEKYYSDDPKLKRAIAGNGRMTGIQNAYKRGNAEEYKKELIEDTTHGIDPNVIKSMKKPVLVRVMQPKDITADIGDKSNTQNNLAMTAVEQANNDASRISLNGENGQLSFDDIKCFDDGTPDLDSVKKFIAVLPEAEQGQMLDTDGNPTRQAQERLQSALFAKAYNNDKLTKMYSQALEPESKTIIEGLSKASASVAKLSNVTADYDIRDIVSRAVSKIVANKKAGGSVADVITQTDMFDGMAQNGVSDGEVRSICRIFVENSRSSNAIASKLRELTEAIKREAENDDPFGFGKIPRAEIIRQVLDKQSK